MLFSYISVKQARCRLDLRALVHHKRDEYEEDALSREQAIANAHNSSFSIGSEWKPQGILISQIHEHKDAITRHVALHNDNVELFFL